MVRLLRSLLLAALLCGNAFAHSGKPKFNVVIDTDGAIDDMRAISMLLSGNDIRVLAITCSQGTLLPESVYAKVSSLLSAFHHEGIPTGVSEGVPYELPGWEPFARNIQWAGVTGIQFPYPVRGSTGVLSSAIEFRQEKIILIALGSLKTYADWIRENPEATGKIERIIWYNNRNIAEGFNYKVDPESFEFIRQSGVLLEVVSSGSKEPGIGAEYLDQIHKTHSVYANRVEEVLSQPSVVEKINNNHLKLWDDLVPLYLTAPILFEVASENNIRYASLDPKLPDDFVYETIGRLLLSANYTNNRVFTEFPVDTALYKPEVAGIVNETIRKFGLIEWKAICMTNEIHGHTGIYSIIGAKMGIRAMEYFNLGVNNMNVVTYAGNHPPLSCFNDGIQISTGATIGQGLITISDTLSATPSALFEFNNQKVLISLDPEIARQMRKEIEYGVNNYGLMSERYWMYIERLAIQYWSDFDRYDIFVIEKL
jgi:pyrimidine-specific ribonucleoside hydrolase